MREDMKSKLPFSRREWLMTLMIVAVVLQAINLIGWYGADEDLLMRRLGLVGTAASILLAVLAIVYTYYSSSTHETSNITLAGQIDRLSSVTQELRGSMTGLNAETSHLAEIRDKMDEALLEVSTQRKDVSAIRSGMESVSDLLSSRQSEGPAERGEPVQPGEIRRILESVGAVGHACLAAMEYAGSNSLNVNDLFDRILTPAAPKLNLTDPWDDRSFIVGVYNTITNVLSSMEQLEGWRLSAESLSFIADVRSSGGDPNDAYYEFLTEVLSLTAQKR